MRITIEQTSQGPITLAHDPVANVLSSFPGVLSPDQVQRQLNINRALDAQQKKVIYERVR
jgi:hypothetical protein